MPRIVANAKAIGRLVKSHNGPLNMSDLRDASRKGPDGPRFSFKVSKETKAKLDRFCAEKRMDYSEAILAL